jgi:dipeptidyl aminopeptidase/acylaminoacyl peptidase
VAFWADSPAVWSPDGSKLAYVADGKVRLVEAGGGLPRPLAEGWSPGWIDDRTLVIVVERDHVSRLALVDVDEPWPRAVTDPTHEVYGVRVADGLGKVVYVVDSKEDRQRSDVWLYDHGTGETRMLAGAPDAHAGDPTMSPDARLVAYVSEEPGWYEVFVVGVDASESRQVTSSGHDHSDLSWSPDGASLLAVRSRHGSSEVVVIDIGDGTATTLVSGGLWEGAAWAGGSVVATHEDHRTPPRLVVVDPEGGVDVLFSSAPASVAAASHVDFETVSYESHDGLEIPGFLFRPDPERFAGRLPAVVYPHGGPTALYADEWDGHAQYFVAKGYAWFAINFRGSTGYGRDFERANHGVWGVADTEDCLAAADYLASLEWIDPDRIAIFGASYGSYLALTSLAKDPQHRFACGVAKYGDSDIATSWALGDREGREDLERMMGSPRDDRAAYRAGSPYWEVENIERPMLIAHGEQDDRVHPDQSRQLADELRRLDKRFEYVTYPTEGHGLLRAGPQVDFYRRLERFLDWHLM